MNKRILAMFALLATFWGTSFVAIEVGLHAFPPLLFAALRYDVAGLIILGYALWTTDRWLPRAKTEWLLVVITGAFIIAAYHGLLYLGEQHVPGAIAAAIISLSPILTAVFASALLPNERLRPLGVAGLLAGLVGVVIIANPNPNNLLSSSMLGIVLIFLGGASFALGSVLTRPFKTSLPLATLEGWAMLVGSGILHVVSFARGESFAAIEWTLPAVTSLAYLTLISGVVAFLLYFELLDILGPIEINLIGYAEPVVATVMSFVLLGHVIGTTTLTGFVAIFIGFALIKRDALHAVLTVASTRARQTAQRF
ncbi:DMT family transporter [Haladaptatus sp. CMSO5]|uniref:DMT family transporter n=1 Tax=Haladaptatus sp. CMSO5 TaxID=3120514 RepID=UPI002FCE1522